MSKSDVDKIVGSRVRSRRLQLAMSQSDLAHALGLSFQMVQKYELGTNRISVSRLLDIATALRCTPEFFYQGATNGRLEDDAMITDREKFMATKIGGALIDTMIRIRNRKKREAVLSMAQSLEGK